MPVNRCDNCPEIDGCCLCYEVDDFADDEDRDPGCCECDEGWKHGCCDDMCRGQYDQPLDCCSNPVPCRCNQNRKVPM